MLLTGYIAQFAPQPQRDPRLGNAHGAGFHVEIGCDVVRQTAFDDDAPESALQSGEFAVC